MLSPTVLVRGNPARAKFAVENNRCIPYIMLICFACRHSGGGDPRHDILLSSHIRQHTAISMPFPWLQLCRTGLQPYSLPRGLSPWDTPGPVMWLPGHNEAPSPEGDVLHGAAWDDAWLDSWWGDTGHPWRHQQGTAVTYLSMLPWIFFEDPLKVNGPPEISRITWQLCNPNVLGL